MGAVYAWVLASPEVAAQEVAADALQLQQTVRARPGVVKRPQRFPM
jgi:hypothetical protein